MELDSARIQTVRPYVFDYVGGVLWLVAVLTALVREEHVHRAAKALDAVAAEMPHVKFPTFVTGFFLVVAGVILPYCVNVILKMPTLSLMNLLLGLQRKSDDSPEAKEVKRLRELAMNTIQRRAGIESYVSSSLSLIYLETLQPTIGSNLHANREDTGFKAYAALPVALIIGFAAGRLAAGWVIVCVAILIGGVLGVSSFLIAVWSTNQTLDNTYEDLAVALLIADSERDPAANHETSAASASSTTKEPS